MLAIVVLLGVAAGSGIKLGRRLDRRRLNEALHELRRPLQGLVIAATPDRTRGGREPAVSACLEAVAEAAAELDRVVNRRRRLPRSSPFTLDSLLADTKRRWAFSERVDLVPSQAGSVSGDRLRLGAALDNLIANGMEHGGGRVRVAVVVTGGSVRIQVRNRAAGAGSGTSSGDRGPRRGHGLRMARKIAAEHGGTLHAPRFEAGDVLTELDLPEALRPAA